jgi:hypothetical protein
MIERQSAFPLRHIVALVALGDEHRPNLLLEELHTVIGRLCPANHRATEEREKNKSEKIGAAHWWEA